MAVGFPGAGIDTIWVSQGDNFPHFLSSSAHINSWFLVLRGLVCALYRGRSSMRNATHDWFSWLQHLGHL